MSIQCFLWGGNHLFMRLLGRNLWGWFVLVVKEKDENGFILFLSRQCYSMSLSTFFLLCVTANFQQRDTMRNGTATFRYDDFIQVAMSS